jgi:hypothetical protein
MYNQYVLVALLFSDSRRSQRRTPIFVFRLFGLTYFRPTFAQRVLWPDCRHDGCERSEDADKDIKPAMATYTFLN